MDKTLASTLKGTNSCEFAPGSRQMVKLRNAKKKEQQTVEKIELPWKRLDGAEGCFSQYKKIELPRKKIDGATDITMTLFTT